MSKFMETFEEIKSTAASKNTTFSRSDFDKLAKAYLNDVDYVADNCKADAEAEGGFTVEKIEAVKLFRGMIKRILKDFGVEEQEAQRVMTDAYQIKNVDGIYELTSELIYQYTNAGKKYLFLTKEDFQGGLILENEEEEIDVPTKGVGANSEVKYLRSKKAHKKMKSKSSTPSWLISKKSI